MNINTLVSTVDSYVSKTVDTKSTSADYQKGVSKVDNEKEKLEILKKEIWNEINFMPWNSQMNISIQITDKAFERMINDPDFKNDMMRLIREESIAAQPPGDTSLTWIDENGYKGYSYIDIESGHTAFAAHSKDKDCCYSKKSKKNALKMIWEEQQIKKQQQKKLEDKEYEEDVIQRKAMQSEKIAKKYEEKTIFGYGLNI